MKTGRSARAISIIALVFAPIALLISFAIYTRDMPLDRTPLLIGALVVGVLEIAGAIATLIKNPLGPKLFVAYGIAALALVVADVSYLVAMPARAHGHGMATEAMGVLGDGIGALFHVLWCFACVAWPIVALVLSRPKPAPGLALPEPAIA